jgi:hypothetical protein
MTVIDTSHNRETGELEQFTIINEQGQPELMKATPSNVLLFDPENKLPFEDGLHGFLNGDEAIVLSEADPEVMVAPTNDRNCYVLRVNGSTVETTPERSTDVLRGIKDAAIDQEYDSLLSLYDEIMSTQVRRPVVNALRKTFEGHERIEETPSGWLIDEFFLMDWSASMYAKTDDPDEADVRRSGSGVVETDTSYEFVQLRMRRDIEPVEVSINGDAYRLTEREMMFLAKVNWLLDRRSYHPDMEFWKNVGQYAAVDWRTGEPESDEPDSASENEPDLDSFNL